jgi:HlyD family secretion protein
MDREKASEMKKLKWLVVTVVVLGLAGVGGYRYYTSSRKIEYQTTPLTRGDIESVVSATGNCNAVVSVQVGSQVSGNILELKADFNTKVSKNQLVAVIDPAPFQARVDQARANVENARAAVLNVQSQLSKSVADIASAQAAVANQRANIVRAQSVVSDSKTKYDRRVQMFDEKVVSKEDRDTAQSTYDQAVANLEAAQAQLSAAQSALESTRAQREVIQAQLTSAQSQVKQNEASLQTAELDLAHTQIRAPVDGTVIARNMDVGQTVAASFSAPTIFQIAQDLTKMQVDTNIDESDISRIVVGQEANFSVDAYPGQTFRGEVVQIRRAPINVQNVITYDVVIQVPNPDLKLFPGMTANVRVLTDRVENVLRLPSAALRVRLDPAAKAKGGGKKGGGGGKGKAAAAAKARGAARQELTQAQTVYVMGEDGQPKPERVRLGIGDGNFVAVLSDNLKEGDNIITGVLTPSATGGITPGFPGGNNKQFKNFKGGGFF